MSVLKLTGHLFIPPYTHSYSIITSPELRMAGAAT